MFFGRSKSKFRKVIFITITALIAIGMVIPLAGLFQKLPAGGGTADTGTAQMTPQERLAGLEAQAQKAPENIPVLMELADAYIYSGKPDQALKTYDQALAVDPEYSDARYMIAFVHYNMNENDLAIAKLQELIEKDPHHAVAHLLYGYVLGHDMKDYAGGVRELEKFIALAGEGPDVEKARLIIDEWKAGQAKE